MTSTASEALDARRLDLWPHALVILVLLLVQVFARDIWGMIYTNMLRPQLIDKGARGCETVVRGEETPDECDLVLERRSDGALEQTFYAKRGTTKTRVRSTASGQFISASSVHWSSIASLVLPFLAFIPFSTAIVHKMIRTRSFFNWQMARHRWDHLEKMLLLYSVPLVLAGIVAPWLNP